MLYPKIEWIKTDPLVTIRVHAKSITGNGYLHSADALEESIMLTASAVEESGVEEKESIMAAIYGRLPILAAHYFRERGRKTSLKALKAYFEKVKLTFIQKAVIYLLYIYTVFGGRGGGRIINKMNIKLNKTK